MDGAPTGNNEAVRWTPTRAAIALVSLAAVVITSIFVVRHLAAPGPAQWKAPTGYEEVQSVDVGGGSVAHLWLNDAGCWIVERRDVDAVDVSTTGGCARKSGAMSTGEALGVLVGLVYDAPAAARVRVSTEGRELGTFNILRGSFLIPLDRIPTSVDTLTLRPLAQNGSEAGTSTEVKLLR